MNDRDRIFQGLRDALSPLQKRAPLPSYPDDVAVAHSILAGREPLAVFVDRLERVQGRAFTQARELADWLSNQGAVRGYVDPVLMGRLAPAFSSAFSIETEFDRSRVDDYAFGITRAVAAIAETGTLILDDETTSSRLGALAPFIHVGVVTEDCLFTNMAQAIAALGSDPNLIWCTGPSKTADIEGILIEGVHGPGHQVALILPSVTSSG